MRYLILSFILFTTVLDISAQQKEQQYYYALDGTKFKSIAGRDIHEDMIVNEMKINLLELDIQGFFKEDTRKLFENYFHTIHDLIKAIRLSHQEIEPMISLNKNILIREGIDIKSGYARNGEWFVLDEYRLLFDSNIDTFNYFYNLTKSMANLKSHNANYDNITESISKRLQQIETDNNFYAEKLSSKTSAIDKITESIIEKEENRSDIESGYYALDGTKFRTDKYRNKYEKAILTIINNRFNRIDKKILNKKTKKHLKVITTMISSSLGAMRLTNDNFKNISYIASQITINPQKEKYSAINNEICATADIRDCINYSIGIYKILNDYATALEQEDATKDIDINNFRDSFGYTIVPLIEILGEKTLKLARFSRELIDEEW